MYNVCPSNKDIYFTATFTVKQLVGLPDCADTRQIKERLEFLFGGLKRCSEI